MAALDYSIGIVAHVDRIDMAHNLSDVVKPKLVNPDDGTLGCLGNHAYVLSRLCGEPGWSVVLEDDALPVNDFHADLPVALELAADLDPSVKVVSLYLGTGYPSNWQPRIVTALANDPCFILCPSLLHAVGYAVAPEVKMDLATWMSLARRRPPQAPDEAISTWLGARQYRVAYTNPSVIQHRDGQPVIRSRPGSFSSARKRPRVAHNTKPRSGGWNDSWVEMRR